MKKKEGLWGAKGPIITGAIIIVLIGIVGFNFYYQSREFSSNLITKDLALLQTIFKSIDEHCKIMSFDSNKVTINFLNVGTFKGSEIGSMRLAYPTEWKGPYVEKNPTIQNREFQIVQTKKGLFIAPGDGVLLPNNKTIGKDIILNENSDIESMIKDKEFLLHNETPLAVPLKLLSSAWQKLLIEELPQDDIARKDEHSIGLRLALAKVPAFFSLGKN